MSALGDRPVAHLPPCAVDDRVPLERRSGIDFVLVDVEMPQHFPELSQHIVLDLARNEPSARLRLSR